MSSNHVTLARLIARETACTRAEASRLVEYAARSGLSARELTRCYRHAGLLGLEILVIAGAMHPDYLRRHRDQPVPAKPIGRHGSRIQRAHHRTRSTR